MARGGQAAVRRREAEDPGRPTGRAGGCAPRGLLPDHRVQPQACSRLRQPGWLRCGDPQDQLGATCVTSME